MRSAPRTAASFGDVPQPIVDAVDLAIDGGALTGLPSTVVDLSRFDETGEWTVLRQGAVPDSEVESALSSSAGRRGRGGG